MDDSTGLMEPVEAWGRRKAESTEDELSAAGWARGLVRLLQGFVLGVTPALLLGLVVLFVQRAFVSELGHGVRSSAAALLPLVVVSFVMSRMNHAAERTLRLPLWMTFSLSLIAGMVVMFLLSSGLFAGVPLTELVMSSSFAVLVFGALALERDAMFSYYYGLLFGMLGFVIMFGVPDLSA